AGEHAVVEPGELLPGPGEDVLRSHRQQLFPAVAERPAGGVVHVDVTHARAVDEQHQVGRGIHRRAEPQLLLLGAPDPGDVPGDAAIAAKPPVLENGLSAGADVAHSPLRVRALEHEVREGLSRLEHGLVPVPAAAVLRGNRTAVPAVRAEELLRVESVPQGASGGPRETQALVLLPVPLRGEPLDRAPEAALGLTRRLPDMLACRLLLLSAHAHTFRGSGAGITRKGLASCPEVPAILDHCRESDYSTTETSMLPLLPTTFTPTSCSFCLKSRSTA